MNSDQKKFKILFLCTGNSARSILAEYLMRRIAPHKFDAYSAGANPKGHVHPFAIRVLEKDYHIDCSDARSKSWSEFQGTPFDFIITVCDNARETCPTWPGKPIVAHWSSPDPAYFEGTPEEHYRFFFQVAQQIRRRIELFTSIPIDKLDMLKLAQLTHDIGKQASIEPAETV